MVKIKKKLVSNAIQRRMTYGGKNPVRYIMVHQTANTSKGADALAHANLQANGNSRQASWHYQVDAKNIYQSFPDTAQAWHAGNRYYNENSIGIELTVNSDGDYVGTVENGAKLVKYLMDKYNVPISRVIRHKDASGKYCPRELLNGKDGITWNKFKQMAQGEKVSAKPSKPSKPSTPSKPSNSVSGAKHLKDEDAYFLITTKSGIKVRSNPSLSAKHTGTLAVGSSIHYYKVYENDGYRWLQYNGNSGNKLYIPYRKLGKKSWGTFHSKRPKGTKATTKKSSGSSSSKKKAENLRVDGYLGKLTISALQRAMGTTVDGVLSKPSLVVREVQKLVGAKVDGYLGPETYRKLQAYLGTPVDGKVSKPSLMWKEVQRRLNNGTFGK